MSMQSETREGMGFGAPNAARDYLDWLPHGAQMLRWLNRALCTAAIPFMLVTRLRRKGSTGRDLERLDRHVLADIGLVKADVVAAVNGQAPAQALPANNNELCPMRGGHGGAA